MEQQAESLLDFAVKLGLEARDLDDLVEQQIEGDAAAAAAINEGSLEEQIPFLAAILGVDELKAQLELLSSPGGPPDVTPSWEGGDSVFEGRGGEIYGTEMAFRLSATAAPDRFQVKGGKLRVYNKVTGEWEDSRAMHVRVDGRIKTVYPMSPIEGFAWKWGDHE